MKRLVSLAVVLFLMSVAAFGAAPSNASLKGTYSFQLSDTHQDFWGQTLMCDDGTGTLVPQFWGGNQVSEDLVVGTMTFDGAGNATASYSQINQFDKAASNATVSCGNGGHAVFDPPTPGTANGTYAVQSDGSGAMLLTLSNGKAVGLDFLLAGSSGKGIRSTVLLRVDPANGGGSSPASGIAVLQ